MIEYNTVLLYNIYREWKELQNKKDRIATGKLVKKTLELLTNENGKAITKQTLYNIFKKFEKRSPKKTKNTPEKTVSISRDLEKIAMVKQGMNIGKKGSPKGTKSVINALEKEGRLENNLSLSQWNRLLRQHHLSNKHFKRTQSVSTKLTTDSANRFVLCDATPVPQYYFKIKEKTLCFDRVITDLHLDDYMAKYKLKKVWIYVIRDLYSGAYHIMIDVPEGRGETSLGWLQAWRHWILPKKDKRIPVCGIPTVVMSDKGSGLTSEALKSFLTNLGVKDGDIRYHLPGRPEAKGFIEGQIRAIQEKIFKAIINSKIENFDNLVNFINEFTIRDNIELGYYEKYYQSLLNNPPNLPKDNLTNIHKKSESRILSVYRTIQIENQPWFLLGANANDLQEGEKITIKTRLDGSRYAEDENGFTYELRKKQIERDAVTYQVTDGEQLKKNIYQKQREQLKKDSKKLVSEMKQESFLPEVKTFKEYEIPVTNGQIVNLKQPVLPYQELKADEYLKLAIELSEVPVEQINPETLEAVRNALLDAISEGIDMPDSLIRELANAFINESRG